MRRSQHKHEVMSDDQAQSLATVAVQMRRRRSSSISTDGGGAGINYMKRLVTKRLKVRNAVEVMLSSAAEQMAIDPSNRVGVKPRACSRRWVRRCTRDPGRARRREATRQVESSAGWRCDCALPDKLRRCGRHLPSAR